MMEIVAVTPSGECIPMQLCATDTVLSVKQRLAAKLGVSAAYVILAAGTSVLANDHLLAAGALSENAQVTVVVSAGVSGSFYGSCHGWDGHGSMCVTDISAVFKIDGSATITIGDAEELEDDESSVQYTGTTSCTAENIVISAVRKDCPIPSEVKQFVGKVGQGGTFMRLFIEGHWITLLRRAS